MSERSKVRTCLWFDHQGEEAAGFYVSLLPNSRIENIFRPDPDGPALVVNFILAGAPYMALNGGPDYQLTPAASISVTTASQEETDRLWNLLTNHGGREVQCGWLTDKYGLSWQIVPEALPRLLQSPDRKASARVYEAMMKMVKIDIAALEAAFNAKENQP